MYWSSRWLRWYPRNLDTVGSWVRVLAKTHDLGLFLTCLPMEKDYIVSTRNSTQRSTSERKTLDTSSEKLRRAPHKDGGVLTEKKEVKTPVLTFILCEPADSSPYNERCGLASRRNGMAKHTSIRICVCESHTLDNRHRLHRQKAYCV